MFTRNDRGGRGGAGGRVSAPHALGGYPQGFSLKRCDFRSHGNVDAALARSFWDSAVGRQSTKVAARFGTTFA